MQCRTNAQSGRSKCRRDALPTRRPRAAVMADNDLARMLGNQGSLPPIQAKMTIGAAGDKHEQEADHVADMVMRMPERSHHGVGGGCGCRSCRSGGMGSAAPKGEEPPMVMMKGINGGSCSSAPAVGRDEEEEEPGAQGGAVQRKGSEAASGGGGAAASGAAANGGGFNARGFERRLDRSRGGGAPLPADVRAFMEPRFRYDFSRVRVHTDGEASAMAHDIHAEAFTTGSDLYFRSGRFDPSSESGRRLLAHELTHVIQQSEQAGDGSTVSRHIQRFSLNGFPATEEAQMRAAIPVAVAKVKACDYLTWFGKMVIAAAINSKRYDYKPDLGLCGWTFPASWYIEIGSSAFNTSSCCDLASTIAHEASHTEWRTEGAARALECHCFNCSC